MQEYKKIFAFFYPLSMLPDKLTVKLSEPTNQLNRLKRFRVSNAVKIHCNTSLNGVEK